MNDPRNHFRHVIGKPHEADTRPPRPDRIGMGRLLKRGAPVPRSLEELSEIEKLELMARAAGPINEPLTVLSDEELEAPLDISGGGTIENLPESAVVMPPPGSIVGYELHESIGQGGQATVYRATQISTGRSVAVKVLPGGYFVTSRARLRFDREVDALARVDHPNVVPIIDRGRTRDGSLFLVMGYVNGRTLDEHLETIESAADLACLFAKIAEAVHELHSRRILHRDLKPSNIRVDHRGEPHVLDFGLARIDSSPAMTNTGQVLGSLPWASPEQARGDVDALDARSDIYAIGVMLATALDGQPPYPTDGPTYETIRHILNTPAVVGRGRKPGQLEAIALRCLEKNPANRFRTAGELAAALREVQGAGATTTCRVPIFSRQPLTMLARAMTFAAVIAMIVIGGVQVYVQQYRPSLSINPPIALKTFTNKFGMDFVEIPKGQFWMGSLETEPGHTADERWRQDSIARPFYLGTREVTQAQYRKVTGENPSNPSFSGDDLPVNQVSWKDATAFCARLSKTTNRHYRLPTEAEWEYACRCSKVSGVLPEADLKSHAWYSGNSGATLHAVAQLQPNQWGLFDMLGGVDEWCDDIYVPLKSLATSSVGPAITVPEPQRVIRGGSFLSFPIDCRPAARRGLSQSENQATLGFRLCMDVESP